MSKNPQSEVILFSRGSHDDESTADDWDDTELLKEYDKAVRPLKALVAERMGISNAELEEASASESCASSKSALEKGPCPSQKRNPKKRRRKGKKKQHREWAVGDHCQATYTVDKKLYEATILSIDVDQGTCQVQYVGYGNTEEQPLHAISHSMGAAVRREQSRVATLDKDLSMESDVLERSSQASSSMSHLKEEASVRSSKHGAPPRFGEIHPNQSRPGAWPKSGPGNYFPGISGLVPPSAMDDVVPPPLPPHVMSSLPSDDSEALSAMLMSWYMSGFHTGYYQGLKRGKN